MPDSDPLDYACTLQGEHAMEADRLRREASDLRQKAENLERQAAWQDERAAWAGALAESFEAAASGSMRACERPKQEDQHA